MQYGFGCVRGLAKDRGGKAALCQSRVLWLMDGILALGQVGSGAVVRLFLGANVVGCLSRRAGCMWLLGHRSTSSR